MRKKRYSTGRKNTKGLYVFGPSMKSENEKERCYLSSRCHD